MKTLLSCALLFFSLTFGMCHSVPLEPLMSLRPVPSDVLPVLDIKEDPPTEFDPRYTDLDNDRLRDKLGIHYQESFMSPTRPHTLEDSTPPVKHSKKLKSRLSDEMKTMKLNRRQRKKFITWIWETTSCPVQYKWQDMGIRYWPRWIKKGSCDSSRSCSIPKGMGCKPIRSTSITILRWHCQGILLNKKYCTWLPIQYPIISECKCGC